jgi:transcriptional antiterminator NusG
MNKPMDGANYPVGSKVKVIEGVFAQLTGIVDGHDPWRKKLRILITIFGRATPVDVSMDEVERDE